MTARPPAFRLAVIGRWRLAILALLGAIVAGNATLSLAVFTSDATLTNNGLSAGSWSNIVYLHNGSGPAAGDTLAQTNMPIDWASPAYESAPAGRLFDYSTDCDNGAAHRGMGRIVSAACGPATWQTAALGGRTLGASVVVDFWEGMADRRSSSPPFDAGQATTTATLRDVTANLTLRTASDTWTQVTGPGWTHRPITLSGPAYVVPPGHVIALTIGATPVDSDLWVHVAYDTKTFPASLRLQ